MLLVAIAGKLVYGEITGGKIPTSLTLGVIVAVIAVAIGASLVAERRAIATPDARRPEAAG